MQPWHQKPFLSENLPLSIFTTDEAEFPPHWHEAVEVVYALTDGLKAGVNNEIYTLNKKDILLISSGDVHYFPPQPLQFNRIILFFEAAFFEAFTSIMKDKRFTMLLRANTNFPAATSVESLHDALETQILQIMEEYQNKKQGYKLALKARLSDILVLLMRYAPREVYSTYEKNRQLSRLERLEQVFSFVEKNFDKNITLEEISAVANYSVYHFTRFFKEATGMTFNQYVNNFRISKAAEYLISSNDSIIEIAFKSGFGSIKNFNRVFKDAKGCSPSDYRKAISED
ncbi:AraC family transcriptional regulator [Clostridium oryzae]|uniref:Transposon Tn10 TetD protein n=1 Tax=Clostridium oryzae TaxID=1450648 RepID=A0A1V4IXW0_9CLOT|nr:AraC family transcriptional regulator [Clostridium oryzae]OPJ64912.1 transposon Tn10 TetD protein [Clostridium oryzae]